DGGIGMLQALGFGFWNRDGKQAAFGAKGLEGLVRITDDTVLPELAECRFRIACDVSNVLCGPQGCSAVYGPQKGADAAMVEQMDGWMESYALLAKQKYAAADPRKEGTGAAGGLGFAFLTFLNGVLEPGIGIVLDETGMEQHIRNADMVITGEGRLDGQTAMGKAPAGVARLAKKYEKPVIALAGSLAKEASNCNREGIDAFFSILPGAVSLDEAMNPQNAKANLADTAEQVFRLWNTSLHYSREQ
ncbi:MAG TPA: glycerate kinase, partial [Lachnospiraceae bacterium]|nr:glycerate kinase [Lachnospiraceae bacterium]